jgi:methionyl-tRNA synthetase
MPNPFYITTPIYYVNARPHLGHAYTTTVADVVFRFNQMQGRTCFFLTGTDEHGDKIVEAAEKENMSPRSYVDMISAEFQKLWPELNIYPSDFIRTTEARHIAVVQQVLQKIYDAGDIYFSEYEGLYCFGCERFYTERELVDGQCPDHKKAPELIREANYFFKMSRYQDWLIDHIRSHPDFIRPERYRNEVLAFLREPLEDLCISRPKSRLRWGITLPFDEEYVTYVWFDALLNYVSALGYPDGERFATFWPHAQHLIAKDILKPHGIYWPIMLKAAGIPVYQHLNVHGYWNVDQSKMSKSLGNVVAPLELKNIYGLDAFRFFLMRDMTFGLDSSFSEEALVERINADLANDLGNLFSRVLAMAHRYFKGQVPEVDAELEPKLREGLKDNALQAVDDFERAMETFGFHTALGAVWKFIGQMNRYVDYTMPWELAKSASSARQLAAVIYNLLEGLRIVSGLIQPVMPGTAEKMQRHLGLDPEAPFYLIDRLRAWGGLPPETTLPKAIALFPRIDTRARKRPAPPAPSGLTDLKDEISIEEFSRVDLRVATVLHAEAVPRADRLIKLEVDCGEKRTIVAGIARNYEPRELIGRQVVIVANLKPARLMGVLSQGMLLAGSKGKQLALMTPDREMTPGTPIR